MLRKELVMQRRGTDDVGYGIYDAEEGTCDAEEGNSWCSREEISPQVGSYPLSPLFCTG